MQVSRESLHQQPQARVLAADEAVDDARDQLVLAPNLLDSGVRARSRHRRTGTIEVTHSPTPFTSLGSGDEHAAGTVRAGSDSRPGGLHVSQVVLLDLDADPTRCRVFEH